MAMPHVSTSFLNNLKSIIIRMYSTEWRHVVVAEDANGTVHEMRDCRPCDKQDGVII